MTPIKAVCMLCLRVRDCWIDPDLRFLCSDCLQLLHHPLPNGEEKKAGH